MSRLRPMITLLLWSAAVASAIWSLDRLGTGALAAPPLRDPGSLGAWAEDIGPTYASIAVLRVIAWGLAWYLAAVTALGVVARLSRIPALVEWADLVTLPPVRRVLSGAVGIGFAATTLAVSALPTAALLTRDHLSPSSFDIAAPSLDLGAFGGRGADDEAPVLRIEDMTTTAEPANEPADAPDTTAEQADAPTPDVATAPDVADISDVSDVSDAAAVIAEADRILDRALDDAATEADVAIDHLAEQAAADQPAAESELPASPAVAVNEQPGSRTWTIEPGDHLWHVAEHTLAAAWGHQPTDAEIAPYWQRVIDTNLTTLADPDNPDLVFPGQVFELPPLD